MTSPEAARSSFSLVTRGPFARLWWTSVISSTGDWITIFATIALGDTIAGGQGILLAVLSRILPGLLFGAAVGVITDRVDRRVLIAVADFGRALLVPMLVFATTLPLLVLIGVVSELLSLLGQSPRAAVVPRLVARANLVNANSLILGATYGTIPIGAAVNWLVTALPNPGGEFFPDETAPFVLAFFSDAATFLVSGLIILSLPTLRSGLADRAKTHGRQPGSTRQDLFEGLAFLWTERTVRRVILGITASLFGGGVIIVIGKPFVEDVLRAGATGFFAVVTTLGIGAGLGFLSVSLYGARLLRRDVTFAISVLVTGFGLCAAALTSTVFGASGWIFLFGLGAGSAYVMGLTHLHETVDDALRGRIFASLFSLMRIALFGSMLIAVPLDSAISKLDLGGPLDAPTRAVMFLGGAVIVLTGLVTLWSMRTVFGTPVLEPATREFLEEASRRSRHRSSAEEEDSE
ncbi:MAG TPA: MFS transporter [Acidimicrobiia bacterium]|jgi:hypothetical protein